jgi:Mitochondrial carrier protein
MANAAINPPSPASTPVGGVAPSLAPTKSPMALQQQQQPLPKSVVFASSGLGGMLGWVLVHPANTLAVRMNLASMGGQPFSFSKMIQESGYRSLYDGAYLVLCRIESSSILFARQKLISLSSPSLSS